MKIFSRSKQSELLVATLVLTFATGLAIAPDAYIPMLARAFLLQWAAVFAVIAVLALSTMRWWLFLSTTFAVALILFQVRDKHVPATTADVIGPSLRIAHMNVLQPNLEYADAIAIAEESNADLISFQEVSPEWANALSSGLKECYPYQHVEPRMNFYGIALFSKLPFSSVNTFIVEHSPFIEAIVPVGSQAVRVLAIHATSPTSYGHFRERNAQLEEVARIVAAESMPTVVIGDLNTVHWDRVYKRFCASSGLLPTTRTDQRTWPSVGPLALIPLDHLLVPKGLCSADVSSFEIPGSDHRGLLADLKFTQNAH